MNRNRKTQNDKTDKVRFEDTVEGKKILNSISAAFQTIRKENEYNGEMRIMQNLSKKNKTKFYTNHFEDDLDKLIRRKTTGKKQITGNDVIIPQIQNKEGYIRTNPPKN